MLKENKESEETKIFAVLTFEKDFYANLGFKVIGYKPDIDNDDKACRIAFFGTIQKMLD
jgi:N-acetylglutamate synthase-like GNAT family acetyltransferase